MPRRRRRILSRSTTRRVDAALRALEQPPSAARLGALAAAWLAGEDVEDELIGLLLGLHSPGDDAVPLAVDCGSHVIVAGLIPHRGPPGTRRPVLLAVPKADIIRA
jgi:hypothetical protein